MNNWYWYQCTGNQTTENIVILSIIIYTYVTDIIIIHVSLMNMECFQHVRSFENLFIPYLKKVTLLVKDYST